MASPCPLGHPCRSVASVRLPGENPIHPDTQHRWPRPRQALGDKGPLLSSARPGTGTGPAQQGWTAGHPRSRTMRVRWGQADGTEPPPWPHPHPQRSLPLPLLFPSQSFPVAQDFRAGGNFRVPLVFPGRNLKPRKGKELVQGHTEQRWREPEVAWISRLPARCSFPSH